MSIVIYKMLLFSYNYIRLYDWKPKRVYNSFIDNSILLRLTSNLNKWHWSPSWSFMQMTTFIIFKTLDVISKKKWIQSFMQYMYFQNYSVWQLKSFYLIIIVFTVNFQSAMSFIKLERSATQLCRTICFYCFFVFYDLYCVMRGGGFFFFYRYFNNYILNEDFHDFSHIITQFKLKTWLIGINMTYWHQLDWGPCLSSEFIQLNDCL